MSNPHEWHIASDKEGFFIEDEYGEEIIPHVLPWTPGIGWRSQSYEVIKQVLHDEIKHVIDNYEPPDPPGFEGGFAEDH